ncbi:tyrosinase-like, partial [Engystomops pustulosus]|uniref:tyrosinase-like n=1 Tax=Engystomops pustulosus TaxID=76066 RepID=UPI003AFAC70F
MAATGCEVVTTALSTDDQTISIRCIVWIFPVYVFLTLGLSNVESQFPRACTTDETLSSRICCPPWRGSPCGEHAGRGECSTKHVQAYGQDSEVPYEYNQCRDDRIDWPSGYYQHYCRCKGNYSGYDCGECKYGHYGKRCDQKKILVRKEIRELNVIEREKFLRYLNLLKDTTSSDYVILVARDRKDPSTFMFRNASIYDLCTWIHHYSTKPILHDCSYAGMRDFAHQGPAFTTWHRLLLLFLERQIHLLTGDDCFALPFYDWSKDKNCSICSDELLGSNDKKGNILESSSFSSWG